MSPGNRVDKGGPESKPDGPLLRTREVADRIGESRFTVYRWTKNGTLPAPLVTGKTGAFKRWRAVDIDRWIEGDS